MSNFDETHVVKSDRELHALCANAHTIALKRAGLWTRENELVMVTANSNARRYGYKDWKHAYNQLSKRFW